jgi:hypothetical protein
MFGLAITESWMDGNDSFGYDVFRRKRTSDLVPVLSTA